MKALLEEQGLGVPYTHNLEDLLDRLVASHADPGSLRRGCKFLIQFAVDARYPGFRATKRQGASALRWAGHVRAAARRLLGIREHRRRAR